MDESKTENVYWRFLKYLISISLSIALLELSGVDATKANVFSFDKFSFSVFILLSICLYSFDNILKSIVNWFNTKRKVSLSN